MAESAIAVAGVNPDLAGILHQHGQIEIAALAEVAGHDRTGELVDARAITRRCRERKSRVGEAAVAVANQESEAVSVLIDDNDIVVAVAQEISGHQADRLRERADGGTARSGVEPVKPRAGAKTQRLAERVRGRVQENRHIARGLVGDDDVRQPACGQVAEGDVRRCDAGGHRDRCREESRCSLQGDRDAVVERVGGDQVVESVSSEVFDGEARGQIGG